MFGRKKKQPEVKIDWEIIPEKITQLERRMAVMELHYDVLAKSYLKLLEAVPNAKIVSQTGQGSAIERLAGNVPTANEIPAVQVAEPLQAVVPSQQADTAEEEIKIITIE